MVTSELAVPEEYSSLPVAAHALVEWANSARAAHALAVSLTTTAFCPAQYKGKPQDAAAAMLAGAEVGLSPMASLRAFDIIQGTAAPRAITLRAIVQSFGHEIVITEQAPDRVVAKGKRAGSTEWQECVWTIDRAKQLGLTDKDQWRKQPQTMLIARATAECARLIASDAILGIPHYTAEEIRDDPDFASRSRRHSVVRGVSSLNERIEADAEPEIVAEPGDPE